MHLRQVMSTRNVRLLMIGQMISQTGTWIQTTALIWVVFESTGSATAVGLVIGFSYLPTLILGMWGGLIADRFDKRRLMLLTQGGLSLQALLLALMFESPLPVIVVLAATQGLLSLVDNPARQALLAEIVDKRLLGNAIGLNAVVFNLAGVVGPALAGVLLTTTSPAMCFVINSLTYMAVIHALRRMDRANIQPPAADIDSSIRDSLLVMWNARYVRFSLIAFALVCSVSFNIPAVLPSYSENQLGRGAAGFGLLSVILGVGSLLGAGLLSVFRSHQRLLEFSYLSLTCGLVVAALFPSIIPASVAFLIVGGSSVLIAGLVATVLSVSVPLRMRGRAMALYMMIAVGTKTVGGPLLGYISQNASERLALLIGASASVAAWAITHITRQETITPPPPTAAQGALLRGSGEN